MVCACVYMAFTYTKAMASDRRRAEMSEGRRKYDIREVLKLRFCCNKYAGIVGHVPCYLSVLYYC